MNLKQPDPVLPFCMTRDEADSVIKFCEENELKRPEPNELSQGWYSLHWEIWGNRGFTTVHYESARHWCAIMLIEIGVPGYWEPKQVHD